MEVGDQLLEEKDFATASLFYQFAKDYEELREGLETYIRALDDRIWQLKNDSILRNQYNKAKAQRETANSDLNALSSSSNYTPLLNRKIAKVYMDMGRNWRFLVSATWPIATRTMNLQKIFSSTHFHWPTNWVRRSPSSYLSATLQMTAISISGHDCRQGDGPVHGNRAIR